MAETFLAVVNEVLDSIGVPQLSAGNFASAVGKQAQVKRLVARVHKSMATQLPDEHLHATYPLKLYKPHQFPGGSGFGVEQIDAGSNPSTITFGGSGSVNVGPTGYNALGSFGQTTCQNCWVKFRTTVTGIDNSQWYRITSLTNGTTLATNQHLAIDQAVSPIGFSPNRIACDMIQVRSLLPANFEDVRDVTHPFGRGVDLEPMDTNELQRRINASSADSLTAEHPKYYAIDYDVSQADGSTRLGPFIWIWPFPAVTRLYHLVYRRTITQVVESSADSVVMDLPRAMIADLLYQCRIQAKVDIQGDPEGAALYDRLAVREQKKEKERQMTSAGTATIQPDMGGYRKYYRRGRRGRRIIVEEDQ